MEENKNNKVIWIGLALILGVAAFTFFRPMLGKKDSPIKEKNSSAENEEYSFISATDLQNQLNEVLIFDSRSIEEFKNEHLIGSFNVTTDTLERFLQKESPNQKIVIIGSNSIDLSAKLLAQKLKEREVENFSILSGGITSWIELAGRTVRQGNPGSLADQAKINLIKADDLKNILDSQDKKLLILDLRPPSQYASGHLSGAQNIPASELEGTYKSISSGKKLVYYSGSELETFQAGVMLFDLGFPGASALEGGIEEWKKKGFPIEK